MRCIPISRQRFFLLVAAPAALALAVVLGARPARADGSRCPTGRLISEGDHMFEVRKKCGDPDFVSQRVDKRKVKVKVRRWVIDHEEEASEQTVEVLVDEWTDLGPRRFIRFVDFENARVTRVTTGAYGTQAAN